MHGVVAGAVEPVSDQSRDFAALALPHDLDQVRSVSGADPLRLAGGDVHVHDMIAGSILWVTPVEIAKLAAAARPSIGVITNVAEAHMETMHDIETVAAAKAELLEALPPGGTSVLNWDDPRVKAMWTRGPSSVVTFGLSAVAEVKIERGPAAIHRSGGGRVPSRHSQGGWNRQHHVTGVGNRGIRHEPFDVGLANGHDIFEN